MYTKLIPFFIPTSWTLFCNCSIFYKTCFVIALFFLTKLSSNCVVPLGTDLNFLKVLYTLRTFFFLFEFSYETIRSMRQGEMKVAYLNTKVGFKHLYMKFSGFLALVRYLSYSFAQSGRSVFVWCLLILD